MTEAELEIHKEVAVMRHEVSDLKADMSEIKRDLSELLALKTKGMGAIWLAGIILVAITTLATKFFLG